MNDIQYFLTSTLVDENYSSIPESHILRVVNASDYDAAMTREDALREELDTVRDLHARQCCVFCNDTGNLRSVHADLQQRLTVAEQLLRETSDYLDGSTRNAVWCDSILHKKMRAALKPAAEVDHGKA